MLHKLKPVSATNNDRFKKLILDSDLLLTQFEILEAEPVCLTLDFFETEFDRTLQTKNKLSDEIQLLKNELEQFQQVKNRQSHTPVNNINRTSSSGTSNNAFNQRQLTDRMASYTTIIGRAMGCGLDVEKKSTELGRWIDRSFAHDLNAKAQYIKIASDGLVYHANQQSNGQSPDNCSDVRKAMNNLRIM